jgi:protein gp37
MTRRLKAMGQEKYRDGFAVRCHPEELTRDFGKKPKRIFVGSMGDLFHNEVPEEFICDVLETIPKHSQHTFIILTKRANRLPWFTGGIEWPMDNTWLGVSIEKEENLWRLDDLKESSAKVKFVSFEPLLGPIPQIDLAGIDWVIVGGESGHGARPMHPDWARRVRKMCEEQKVPFFFKQWGAWLPGCQGSTPLASKRMSKREYRNRVKYILRPGGNKESNACYAKCFRVGKKAAGRMLDGRTWDEFPKTN